MAYFVFLLFLVILLFLTYNFFGKDVLSPPVILDLTFVFVSFLALYNYNYWKLYNWGWETCGLIILGIVSFELGCFFSSFKIFSIKISFNRSNYLKEHIESYGRINLNQTVLMIFVILCFMTMLYFAYFVFSHVGFNNAFISNFKALKREGLVQLPFIVKGFYTFSHMAGVICIAVFLNNLIVKDLRKRDFILLVIPLFFIIMALFNATRGEILEMLLSSIAIWYILHCRLHGWKFHLQFFASKAFRWAVIVLILFAFTLMLGRGSFHDLDIMSYICNYTSGALAAFDVFLKQGGGIPKWFGEETFVTLNNNLNSIFNTGLASNRILEFRSYDGYSVVNIYTSFRRFFHDFGILGVFVLPLLQGFITNKLYLCVKKAKSRYGLIDFSAILFGYFFSCIIYIAIEDTFYSSDFSISGILKIVELFLTYIFFFYMAKDTSKKYG